ncbi:2-hydroxyacid dehydrogenase [Knoellia subterranea KCTC 19937]|uniref:2-hydroxyacid dehydrogenase n=1 Tax=Knoellia subterranea KCTC 19937 TaxID=1385521 RepID=A0A0A0JJH3_9MICO|nr:2-hydroxyacid dehydrogenase [Knoellia subterranea KCTC 19937]
MPDLADVDVLLTGWGCPPVDAAVLDRAPRLRAIIHTAGSVKHHITQDCWDRGIAVTSAVEQNAVPVAEFTLAAILFAQKRVIEASRDYANRRDKRSGSPAYPFVGNYRRTVGIVGASRIGRRVIELLRPFDMDVLLADPFVDATEAQSIGAALVDLDELVAAADTVSIHAPSLPETERMIDRRRLSLMRDGAVLINTARGALVDEEALTDELVSGRLHAVLDVTVDEVLAADSPLWGLPNVLLTPHVAGSLGGELERLVDHALDELERWITDGTFSTPVDPTRLGSSA